MAGKRSRGGVLDFSTLPVGGNSPVDGGENTFVDGQFRANVPVADLAMNPRNPRHKIGDLSNLASIVERQLQPGTVVSRARWLQLWPEDASVLGDAQWVVINGNRRLAACVEFGRPGMDVVIRDSLAEDRHSILWAAVAENIDREDFDVIEEAEAVELLVAELGQALDVAKRLNRSNTWVSQRRKLLKLAPELREAVRAGDLAVRQARELAMVPAEEQVAARAAQAAAAHDSVDDSVSRTRRKARHAHDTPKRATRPPGAAEAPPPSSQSACDSDMDVAPLAHDRSHPRKRRRALRDPRQRV